MNRFALISVFALVGLITCIGGAEAASYDCGNCSDCSNYIQNSSSSDIVQLTQNLTNVSGTCVNFNGADDIIFDCQGFTIGGDNTGSDYAVELGSGSDNNTVRGCTNLTAFYGGILLSNADNNTIVNNTANNNTGVGYYLNNADDNIFSDLICNNNSVNGIRMESNSQNNIFSNIVANDNLQYGIHVGENDNTFVNISSQENIRGDLLFYTLTNPFPCSNNFTNITGSGGRDIEIYNYSTTIQNKELSALILCNANNSVVSNITIRGSSTIDNSALSVLETTNATIYDINSSENQDGIFVSRSFNVTISNSTTNDNYQAGLYFYMSGNNTVSNVTSRFNGNGIYLTATWSAYNVIVDSVFNENNIGVYLSNADNNTVTNITANSNTQYGIQFYRSTNYNTVNDSHVENNTNRGIYFSHITTNRPEYNLIYNNYISNDDNYWNSTNLTNYFNATLTLGTNVLGGPYLGGNYWTNSSGDDYSDTCFDSNGNSICDINYSLDGVNYDYLPLTIDSVPPQFSDAQVNSTLSNNTIRLNLTVTDDWEETDTVLFGINSINYTYTGNIANEFYLEFDCTSVGNGNYTWNITWANDTSGNLNSTIGENLPLNFTCDITEPYNTSVINETNITKDSAVISWQTNELASGRVYLDTNQTNLTNGYNVSNITINNTYTTNVTVYLTDLVKQTDYYFNISSCDQAGNCNSTGVYNFTTLDCTESWSYSAWSACSSSTQTRTASDQNSCGTTDNRSVLSQSCDDGGGGSGGGGVYTPPGEKNASRRPTLVPGVGLRNNTKLQAAIQKVLQISNMSERARENMMRLSESISSQLNMSRDINIVNKISTLTIKIRHVGHSKIKNFMFYDIIPKDFAEHVDNISVSAPGLTYEVVEEDPELVFMYSDLDPEEEVTIIYTVDTDTGTSVIDDFEPEVYAYEVSETVITDTACEPESTRCSGSEIQECGSDGSDWVTVESCLYGCTGSQCNQETQESNSWIWWIVIIAVVAISGIIIVLHFLGFLNFKCIKRRKK